MNAHKSSDSLQNPPVSAPSSDKIFLKKFRKLLPKHQDFLSIYLAQDVPNATAAVLATYPNASYESARRMGSEILTRLDVKAALQAYQGKKAKNRLDLSEKLIREYKRLALFNIADLFDDNGKLIPIKDLPRSVAASIKSIKARRIKAGNAADIVKDEDILELVTHDKLKAMDSLAKILKIDQDPVEKLGDTLAAFLDKLDGKSTGRPGQEIIDITPEPERIEEKKEKPPQGETAPERSSGLAF